MSAMAEVLARSRTPGRFIERKRFSLSRDKAVEKLREFALRHPQQYVLELVQAAVFAGARWIAFDIEPDRLLFAYVGGRPLDGDGLANIFDYLFTSGADPANRHMVQLAIALNAILQRNPTLVRIETGDGTPENTVRMDLDKKGVAVLGTPERYLSGTYLLVEFGSGWFDRFVGDAVQPEQALIEERCRYTPVPILLNGSAPFGYRGSRDFHLPGVANQQYFDDGGRRGVLAAPGPLVSQHEVDIVVGGVHVTSVSSQEFTGGPPLIGVICDDGLRKTADQSDIVRDAAWLRLRHALADRIEALVRKRNKTWHHPPLPPIPQDVVQDKGADQAPARVAAEPLPEVLALLGPGSEPDLTSLQGLDPGDPLFYVVHDDAAGLGATLDPARFPHRVLRLTEGQAISLREHLPGRSISRLSGVADADFVGRALGLRPDGRAVTVSRTLLMPSGEEVPARIVLQAHPTGVLPGWGLPEEGVVPLLVAHGRRALLVSRLPLDLPRVSVRVDLEDHPRSPRAELLEPLAALALQEAWRLVAAVEGAGGEDLPAAELLAALLGAAVVPRLVEAAEVTGLAVAFPAQWPAEARALAEHALATGPDGPLTLQRLVALQGGAAVHRVDGDLARLEGLEHRLGFGHVIGPELESVGLMAVGWTGRRWRWLGRWFPREGVEPQRDVGAAIVVLGAFEPEVKLPSGWSIEQTLGPGVAAIARSPDHGVDPGEWRRGAAVLLREVQPIALQGQGTALTGGSVSERRLAGRARLAVLQLARFAGTLDAQPLFSSASGAAARPLTELERDGGLRVCARHGVAVDEQQTVSLSLDELAVVEAHRGRRIPLRFDDPPSVWQSLQAGGSDGWLLREEVRAPGLRGQLGLRYPFDPTSGVFLSSLSALVALPELDRAVPCHGLVVLTGGEVRPTTAQAHALRLGRVRLYQRLASLLVGDLSVARRTAAERYGGAYAAWQAGRGALEGSARAMAAAIPVGEGWTLADWFDRATRARPGLPLHLQTEVNVQRDRLLAAEERARERAAEKTVGSVRERLLAAGQSGSFQAIGSLTTKPLVPWLEERLGAALTGRVPRLELTDSGGEKSVVVELPWVGTLGVSRSHPLVRAAWKGSPAARELLAVELIRQMAARLHEDPIDLPRALEALVTVSLDG